MHRHDMTRRLFLGSLGTTLALPELRLQAQGQAPAAPAANVEKDVVYGKGGDADSVSYTHLTLPTNREV